MNNSFTNWAKDDGSHEEQIDPSFSRHQDTDFAGVTVDEVTAAAAVANATNEANVDGSERKNEGDELRSQLAAEIQRQQQHQAQQQQHQRQQARQAQQIQHPVTHEGSVLEDDKKDGLSSPRLNARPVSNTKRAAQNRNAQKAFRQRKEKYIKELEATASEVTALKQTIEELRAENLQLRDYTLALQSRVIELTGGHGNNDVGVPTPPFKQINN